MKKSFFFIYSLILNINMKKLNIIERKTYLKNLQILDTNVFKKYKFSLFIINFLLFIKM